MDQRIHSSAQRKHGVNPWGADFPFVDTPDELQGLFVDLYIASARLVEVPIRVSNIKGFQRFFYDPLPDEDEDASGDTEHLADLVIIDANGDTFVDTADMATYRQRAYGPVLHLHEWIGNGFVIRAVQHSAFPRASDFVDFDEEYDVDIEIDARCLSMTPGRVGSIDAGELVSEDFILTNGFNTELRVEEVVDGLRRGVDITIDVSNGSGLGRYPGCSDPSVPILTINGVGPDDRGAFWIESDGCISLRNNLHGPWYDLMAATSTWQYVLSSVEGFDDLHSCLDDLGSCGLGYINQFADDCEAPCKPPNFVNTYKAVILAARRLKVIGQRIENARTTLAALIDKFGEEKQCRENRVVNGYIRQISNTMAGVTVSVCNTTHECLRDVAIYVQISALTEDPGSVSDCELSIVSCSLSEMGSRSFYRDGGPRSVEATYLEHDDPSLPFDPLDCVSAECLTFRRNRDILWPGESLVVSFQVNVPCGNDSTTLSLKAGATSEDISLPLDGEASIHESTLAIQECA